MAWRIASYQPSSSPPLELCMYHVLPGACTSMHFFPPFIATEMRLFLSRGMTPFGREDSGRWKYLSSKPGAGVLISTKYLCFQFFTTFPCLNIIPCLISIALFPNRLQRVFYAASRPSLPVEHRTRAN
ncbi:hypothetical protein J8273_3333 [Carpediemonas membranifera]|uniref:Uncharacterized protein n=1 Tax=Carpediemonas membranifera TaxID=201153 RepID=A0A8J6BX83_9EUKA|nr:hypothetical protein J8273_3333 [Carpediemonas membranifera]|eukprot:KAG9393201.1 hypothetical protein J8273_3333 [Carpediemonas membranifera]